jgi:neutral ceramidase
MSHLLIGVASRDITPPVGSILVGYNTRPSTSVGHRLRAEAMVVRSGEGAWALVTTDLCAVARPFVEVLRRQIAMRVPLRPEAILVSADHTHSGPAANRAGWSPGHPDEPYFRTLERELVSLVVDAWNGAAPGALEIATTSAPDLASNRRGQDVRGTWVNLWDDPEGTHTGWFDPTVTLTGARRPDGRLEALLVTYGCHPVVLGNRSFAISSDYCGYLKDALERDGAAGTVLFAVSGHGDVDPRVCVQPREEPARRMGEDLASIVRAALPRLRPVEGAEVASRLEPWRIERTRTLVETPDMQFLRAVRAGEAFDTEVIALRAGSLAVVGLPGEAVSAVAASVRKASPFADTLVLSLANDTVGYLPTDEIQRQGAHEASYSPAEGLEAPLLARARAALAAVR